MTERRTSASRRARGLAAGDPRHGTYNGYGNYGCRCAACTRANTDYHWRGGWVTAYHRRNGVRPRAVVDAERAAQHGTESRYSGGCRCDFCREAANEARRARRAANPAVRERENKKRLERYHAAKREVAA